MSGAVRLLVAQGGLIPTDGSKKSKTTHPWSAWGSGFFTVGQEQASRGDGQVINGATPFFPGGEGQAEHDEMEHVCTVQGRKETVESLNGLGHPRAVRSNNELNRQCEHFVTQLPNS